MISKNVSVIGVGRVGLPLAIFLANEGFNVYGVGKTKDKADTLNKGIMPFMEKGVAPLLKKYINRKLFFSIDAEKIIPYCCFCATSETVILSSDDLKDANFSFCTAMRIFLAYSSSFGSPFFCFHTSSNAADTCSQKFSEETLLHVQSCMIRLFGISIK